MKNNFLEFVDSLSQAEELPNVFNQYSRNLPENEIRRNNLSLYLKQMQLLEPKILLVGEAPGYHGCRFTGVPFTSEHILLKGFQEIELFGRKKGYAKTNELARIKKEQSATIVWKTLTDKKFVPLMWNAFPFHPFQKDDPTKNRTPSQKELEVGAFFLAKLINDFDIPSIVAVGNNAEKTLAKINIPCQKIRHPSNGGKPDFIKGIEKLRSEA